MLMLKSNVDSDMDMFGICISDNKGIDTLEGVLITMPGLFGSGRG